MTKKTIPFSVLLFFLLLPPSLHAEWTEVVPGIDYQKFTLSGPNNVFVTRLDRSDTSCIIDSCIAQGKLVSGRQPVSGMANLYNDSIGYWGQTWGNRYQVVAAINGDGFSSDQPTNGQITSGWYAKKFNAFSGAGLAWTLNRGLFIAECVSHTSNKNRLTYPRTSATQNLDDINTEPGSDEIVMYTPQYSSSTPSTSADAEVVLSLTRPNVIMPSPNYTTGVVAEVKANSGSTRMLFDQAVLRANGAAASKILSNVQVGDTIQLSQEINHYERDCSTRSSGDFTKTYSCIGYMAFVFLRDGIVDPNSDNAGATALNPRTAVAYNDDYVYFVVVDGRSGISIGMNMEMLGNFCLDTLGATWGLNQDGGGSSAMWVDGTIRNVPSDGSERYVTNGLMMIKVQPLEQSESYLNGDTVTTAATTNIYAGPGTNFGTFGSVSVGSSGQVQDHSINGVYAKSDNWWHCDFNGTVGWIKQSGLLAKTPTPVSNATDWEGYE